MGFAESLQKTQKRPVKMEQALSSTWHTLKNFDCDREIYSESSMFLQF